MNKFFAIISFLLLIGGNSFSSLLASKNLLMPRSKALIKNSYRNTQTFSRQSSARRTQIILFSFSSSSNEAVSEKHVQKLMQLRLSAAIPQALKVFVQLDLADILSSTNAKMTVEEIGKRVHSTAKQPPVNQEALERTLRVLATVGVVEESSENKSLVYTLTQMGELLGSNSPLKSMIHYFVDDPLWAAWGSVPEFVAGIEKRLPFDAANGISTQDYYSNPENVQSLKYANDFVRYISQCEIEACVRGVDWGSLNGRTVVDLGGFSGKVLEQVSIQYPRIKCICLDLPEVVASLEKGPESKVELVGGDMFDPETFPVCDAIFMKHIVLCEFDAEQSLEILRSCYKVLPQNGRVIIAESVLPDLAEAEDNQSALGLYIDYFMMLDGRSTSYTTSQWNAFVEKAGFSLDTITATGIHSCFLLVLTRR